MQSVAREMNLSETAFLNPEEDGYRLRWFTPAVEVKLCGHATLASAHVLFTESLVEAGRQVRFQTRSGLLTAERRGELVELDFPARHPKAVPADPQLAQALGVEPVGWWRDEEDVLLLLADEPAVRAVAPDFRRLRSADARGVIVTAPSANPEFDFVSRFFAPAVGVDEDPVTGSAHCALAPFWQARLGRAELHAFQASARGGSLVVRVRGERVALSGRAVTVLRGQIVT